MVIMALFLSPTFATSFNKKTMRKSMITLNRKWIRLIGIVGCTMCLASCKQASDASGMKPSYATMKVEATDKELSTSYSATIRGRQDIDIYPQVSGTIEKLCVTEGQKVRRGQLLFIIDQVPYKAALKTAVANVEAARAALATAELTYNSNKELYAQKVVSEFSLKTAENSYLTAKAQLSQAEAQEISARNNLSYTEVKSPSDGVVGALPYRAGALVSPSLPQPLTTVSDNSDMYVYFSMTENQLLALTRQYGSMDEALKNMPAVFPNESRLLHSGASGTVVVPTTYKNCIVIPQEATVQLQDKTVVYKVVDGKAVSTLITVAGINDGREYVVLDGLKVGDEIVSTGAGLLREGTQVK